MATEDPKEVLVRYLQVARDAMVWKLDGLSEYDMRRPLVPTGTNLLGLVKHLAGVESIYFGSVFGRPYPEELEWYSETAPANADMWATPDESSQSIIDLYHRVQKHGDETIASLDLDAPGVVPWWSAERKDVTLQVMLVHVIAETNRHAGHADIVRELIDGSIGHRQTISNAPDEDAAWWDEYRGRVQAAAESFRDR